MDLISRIRAFVDEQKDRFLKELGGIHCRILKPFAYYLSGEAQNCSHVYKKGAEIVMQLFMDADRLIKEMPESERYRKAPTATKT